MKTATCKHRNLDRRSNCKDCGKHVDLTAKRNKYGNRRTDGFDSAKEAKRYQELRALGVMPIQRQVGFDLSVNGVHICDYRADFVYEIPYSGGQREVEDVKPKGKGFKKTAAYRMFEIKKRLMLAVHQIDVKEV